MRLLLSYLFLIALSTFSFAQQQTEFDVRKMVKTASEDDLVKENSRMLQDNYFFFAEIVVDRLLQIKPESANYNYRKGFIILDSRQDWISAMPYLQKAVTDLDKNFDAYAASEKSAPTDALYHLARCYHYDAQLDKAREYYNRFINESNAKSELIEKSKLRLQQCDIAQKLIEAPRSAKVVNIGEKINTVYPEYSPVISFDGSAIYFTSRRQWADNSTDEFRDPLLNQFPEDIYVSYRDFETNQWQDPERLTMCDGRLNEATVTVSADERRIYTYEDRTGNGDIYFADFRMNKFRDLTILPYSKFNTQYWETHCTVTPDGLQMYFVSDRPDGLGGRDIYRMVKLPNGTWSAPLNLGPTINTPYDEDSPFIAVDNKTLYFSSNGPLSMGEFDIFVSVRDEEGNWSTPVNLGYPINSPGDDVFYTTTADGSKGYLTSFRRDGKGEKDIYEIENDVTRIDDLAILKATLRTSDGSPVPERICAMVKCTSCDFIDEKLIKPRVRDGVFLGQLAPCREYEIAFKLDSTVDAIYTTTFRTECKHGYQEVHVDVVLDIEKNIIVPDLNYRLDGNVTDSKTDSLIAGATLTFKDKKTGKILETVTTDEQGQFRSNALKDGFPGKKINYEVTVSKEKYITQSFEWNITLDTVLDHHLSYSIEKIDIGLDLAKIFDLKPIYFDLNKSNIRPDAKKELDKIVKALNDNPTVEIELGSHTDCRSSKAYNATLSDKRAKASAAYIKARITNPNRIYGKGYGESQLVNGCECEGAVKSTCTEAEHQANRRTEFKIVKY
jgi:outer membrane protein OmpA-like peptidoglycan-associated protein/tetratricopeptide (TPR) repeat protein